MLTRQAGRQSAADVKSAKTGGGGIEDQHHVQVSPLPGSRRVAQMETAGEVTHHGFGRIAAIIHGFTDSARRAKCSAKWRGHKGRELEGKKQGPPRIRNRLITRLSG